ncbi:hypothetical protein SAMN05421736_102219 [Evansella caseinilytica]|uniref:Uncharacterized protein n=1 Tax=Evansella caseinilytica TaxID=1503961 RepID=A0A1H3KQY3_9BACI|nr:sodium:proton antiporter [Evansella caseinilytica]SDY54188.1 hypothetical protein SAMN05421736_102219 [Evansella caseinilytica]
MQRILFIAGMIFGLRTLIKYRYRIMNAFLSNQWLRRFSVAMIMRIPAVRDKMMYQILR